MLRMDTCMNMRHTRTRVPSHMHGSVLTNHKLPVKALIVQTNKSGAYS